MARNVRQQSTGAASCYFRDLWKLNAQKQRGAPSKEFAKFNQPGKTPTQVFQDKYHPILKQHGWGGGGKKLPKNWDEREKA